MLKKKIGLRQRRFDFHLAKSGTVRINVVVHLTPNYIENFKLNIYINGL